MSPSPARTTRSHGEAKPHSPSSDGVSPSLARATAHLTGTWSLAARTGFCHPTAYFTSPWMLMIKRVLWPLRWVLAAGRPVWHDANNLVDISLEQFFGVMYRQVGS